MGIYGFFVMVHLGRFSDLALVVGDHKVLIEPFSAGRDGTVEVYISGEASTTRKLDRSLQKIKHIMSIAPASEEV